MTKGDFFRYCRLAHGWLSAVAFVALGFFCITGLLLNHPDWMTGAPPDAIKERMTLDAAELKRIQDAEEPATALVEIVGSRIDLRGELTGGNIVRHELFARLQGVRGLSDLRANLNTGELEIIVEPARGLSILNELHRGERAGSTWRLLIDVVAIALLVLAILGYLIFLSMRSRLRTAVILTALGTAGLWFVFTAAVR